MAIEFRCSQCSQLLRVPDDSAGKNARCPKCQALMTVPGTALRPPADDFSSSPGGALPSQFASAGPPHVPPVTAPSDPYAAMQPPNAPPPPPKPFAADPFSSPAAESVNPYASPAATAYPFAPQFHPGGPRPGLPWEYEQQTIGC